MSATLPGSLGIILLRSECGCELGSRLLPSWRQELMVNQRLQRVTERNLGIDNLCEARLAQLDGTHEGPRSHRGAIRESEVGMLVPLTDQLPQAPRAKTILCDDFVPDLGVFREVCRHTRRRVRSSLDAKGFGDTRPHLAPLEHVAIGDVESLVRCLRRLSGPYHHVSNEVCIGGFPHE